MHAVGSPDSSRSHFDAQDYLELGTPGIKNTQDGFLARAVRGTAAVASPVEAVAVTQHLPRSLQGDRGALAFATLEQLRVRPLAGGPGGARGRSLSRRAFEALYDGAADEPVGASGKEAFAAVELLERKLGEARLRGGEGGYPNGYLGQSMRLLAALIKADVGVPAPLFAIVPVALALLAWRLPIARERGAARRSAVRARAQLDLPRA